MVARTIKVGVVMCCYHLGVCCEGHVLLQPQNGCVVKGISETFIDYNKVSTHMIKAAAEQVSTNHIHTTIIVAMVTQRSIITNYNCDVTVLKSSTSSVKKTNDTMATSGMYK